jgi:hypothetical protein
MPDVVLVVGILWLILFVLTAVWAARAGAEYIRLHRSRAGSQPTYPVLEDIAERYSRDPLRWFVEAPGLSWRAWKLDLTPQADSELEAARRRMLRRWWLTVAVAVVGWLILAALMLMVARTAR